MRITPHFLVLCFLVLGLSAFLSGCAASEPGQPKPPDLALMHRLEKAFDLEKQRRASIQQPTYAPRNAGLDSIQGLRTTLASERQRRTQLESEVSALRAQGAEHGRANAELASLRAELAGERDRNRSLKKELERSNKTSAEAPNPEKLNALSAQLARERQRRQALEAELARLSSGKEGSPDAVAEVARLRAELDQEKRRRLEVEKAWVRLREETSMPALSGSVSEAEFLAVKEELSETRRALDAEREARQRADARAQEAPAVAPRSQAEEEASANLHSENQRLRQRVSSLQRERDVLKRAINDLSAEPDPGAAAEETQVEPERIPVH